MLVRMERAKRYVHWLDRNARAVLFASAVALAAALYLVVFHLPLYADFAYLLPANTPAVRDLHRLDQRIIPKDTTIVVVEAPDPATRAQATEDVAAAVRALGPAVISRIETDD